MRFNAWTDPWIPVRGADGEECVLSLHDLLAGAPELTELGPGLTPLDLDSLYRFLPSIFAVAYRAVREEDRDGSYRIPAYALAFIGDTFGERFELFGDRPFLQRWDKTYNDLLAVVPAKKSVLDIIKPIEQLHPHVPGGSSSQWAVRRDQRVLADPAALTLQLVTTWFQTKNSNSKDPWGRKLLRGSAGTWAGKDPLAVHLSDPGNLARTIAANTPREWLGRDDLPLYLDHEGLPTDFGTAAKTSVTRFTYARTLPLLIVVEGELAGFVLGPDDIDLPPLATEVEDPLSAVHDDDHTRLYITTRKKARNGETRVERIPRRSFGVRLSSTEGFENWFRADKGIGEALNEWRVVERVHTVPTRDQAGWKLSVLSEVADDKGNRTWAAWDEVSLLFGAADGRLRVEIQELFSFAAGCHHTFVSCARTATGDENKKTPPVAEVGQAAFYAAIMPVVSDLETAVTAGSLESMERYYRRVADIAVQEFDAATSPMLTPARVADVAKARGDFRRYTYSALKKIQEFA